LVDRSGKALPIFVDIDGTLTDFGQQGGNPIAGHIEKLKKLIAQGVEVIIWSGGGTDYAKKFAEDHAISGVTCIGKPSLMVDDNPNVRPVGTMVIVEPAKFFSSLSLGVSATISLDTWCMRPS